MEGGCQGCSLAEVTHRTDKAPSLCLWKRVPKVVGLVDVTITMPAPTRITPPPSGENR